MKKGSKKEWEEEILNSLDDFQRAEVPPFFYTHLVGKLQSEQGGNTVSVLTLKPVILNIAMVFTFIFNIIVISERKPVLSVNITQQTKTPTINAFEEAYNLEDDALYK